MSPIDQPAIPKGSTVLVTGASGFIASHIADQFLKLGYVVRGTTRDPQKQAWLPRLFDAKYGPGAFELVAVPDMVAEGAYDVAMKGVAAVIHVATINNYSYIPDEVIPGTIAGTMNALVAASKEPSVKRVVLTSSSCAALIPKPNNPVVVTVDTWNEETVELVTKNPPNPNNWYPVYAASKVLAEQEAWKFVREKKPGFVLNTILPNMNFGPTLDLANQGHQSTSGMLAALFKGDSSQMAMVPSQYFVDVQDTALLHVAAAIHPGVESERVFAFAKAFNGDEILDILHKMYPDRTFPPKFQEWHDLSEIVPRKRAEELLRDMGKDGWTSIEDSIRRNTEDIA